MIIFKEREPVLIVNSILKAPISKKSLGCFSRYPFGKKTYLEQAKILEMSKPFEQYLCNGKIHFGL
jgi:L-asparaginase II